MTMVKKQSLAMILMEHLQTRKNDFNKFNTLEDQAALEAIENIASCWTGQKADIRLIKRIK